MDRNAPKEPINTAESGYLDAYDYYVLVGPRTVLVYDVHLTDSEIKTIGERTTAVAFFRRRFCF